MRVLVTGVSGFVGGHLAEHLVASGDIVAGVSASGRWPEGPGRVARSVGLERCDLADVDEADLAALIGRKRPAVIDHLAARAHPRASESDPRGTWAVNLGGTLHLLEAVPATDLKPRIVLVGSGVCHGIPGPGHLPVTEDGPLRPTNPYAASKGAAAVLGIPHHLAHGADVVIVRPFNHAGPRQSPNHVLSALARQVAEVERGRSPRVEVGHLHVVRDFTDVRDVVRAYHLLAETGAPAAVYNLGTGHGTAIADALETPRARRSRSTSIPPASARSIRRCSSPTPRSSAPPPPGNRASRSLRPWPTCSITGAPPPRAERRVLGREEHGHGQSEERALDAEFFRGCGANFGPFCPLFASN